VSVETLQLFRRRPSPTMRNVTWEAVWDVLKWVLLVLAAGFVGQFGRSFALRLIERNRLRTAAGKGGSSRDQIATAPDDAERTRIEAAAKLEKKRAKSDLKKVKKSHRA